MEKRLMNHLRFILQMRLTSFLSMSSWAKSAVLFSAGILENIIAHFALNMNITCNLLMTII